MKILIIRPTPIPVNRQIHARSTLYNQLMTKKNGLLQQYYKIDVEIIALEASARKTKSLPRIPKHYLLVRVKYDKQSISSHLRFVYKLTLLGKVDLDKVKAGTIWFGYNGNNVVQNMRIPVIHLDWKKII